MHGFILTEFKGFVVERLGTPTWYDILKRANLASAEYVNFREYDDREAQALVAAAAEVTGIGAPSLLGSFGECLAQALFRVYRPLIPPEWRTFEFLLKVEDTIHEVVRTRNKHARPPRLWAGRVSTSELLIEYESSRGLCSVAMGILRGVAKHYDETVEIEEERCGQRGDGNCMFRLRRVEAERLTPAGAEEGN